MPPTYSMKNGVTSKGTQRFKPDPKKYLYNIDTLWLNVGAVHYDTVMDYALRDILISGRESRNDDGENTAIEVEIEGYENPVLFEVHGGNPPLYQYSLRNDSMAIYFAKSDRKNGQLPMRVQINQFPLWEKGVEGAYFEAMAVLKALMFNVTDVKLNRVDFAVHSDQFKWTFWDMDSFNYPRNIKDDNKPNFFKLDPDTGEFGTMMVGDRSRLAIRIYNKTKEIEDKQKFYFYDLYRKKEMDIHNIWNIEIECRRPFLKELVEEHTEDKKIFDDFNYCLANDGLSKLWSLLMRKYNHNSTHWGMLNKLDKHFRFNDVHGLTVEKDTAASFEKEVPQILGRLSRAVITEKDMSLGNAIKKLYEAIPEYEERQKRKGKNVVTFEERVMEKKSLILNKEINSTITGKKDISREREIVRVSNEAKLSELMSTFIKNNNDSVQVKNITSEKTKNLSSEQLTTDSYMLSKD
ncbi:replication initiation protein [Lysinibacillus fusiformis]